MNKIKLAAVTVTAAALLVPLSTTPAQAADPVAYVCNSSYSWERIRGFNNDVGSSATKTINPGGCANINDRNGHARVDVDPAGVVDVNSWTKRKLGDPWTSLCYAGENHASDPFSAPAPGTSYWNFQTSNCTIG